MWLLPALLLLLLPGCSAALSPITGPATVSGLEQGSLALLCRYASAWKAYRKYWCRGSNQRNCQILVMTTGSEQEVKKDRISIRDDQKNFTFTVTMEDLRRDDTDIYWCGIEKVSNDIMIQVKVTIEPAPEDSSAVRATTETSLAPTLSTTEKITSNQPVTHTLSPLSWSPLSSVHFLFLVFLELPLLLSMLGAVLWVNRPLGGPGKRQSRPEEMQESWCPSMPHPEKK